MTSRGIIMTSRGIIMTSRGIIMCVLVNNFTDEGLSDKVL